MVIWISLTEEIECGNYLRAGYIEIEFRGTHSYIPVCVICWYLLW